MGSAREYECYLHGTFFFDDVISLSYLFFRCRKTFLAVSGRSPWPVVATTNTTKRVFSRSHCRDTLEMLPSQAIGCSPGRNRSHTNTAMSNPFAKPLHAEARRCFLPFLCEKQTKLAACRYLSFCEYAVFLPGNLGCSSEAKSAIQPFWVRLRLRTAGHPGTSPHRDEYL